MAHMPAGRDVPPPPNEDPDDQPTPIDPPERDRTDPDAPGRERPPREAPPETESERVHLDDAERQGVRDRNASKGRRYVSDPNPSAEGNDPSLSSGPTRERRI
ncbi:hypothetical protein [Luteimonas huabeiensis]|uniref:hypothetical protein n=1 Tax=Luteimonas huabeiensis TaxID=1244513 RepID=UPI00046750C1|nr:hypothetical protein [Luteimonas huabeiensis]